MTPRPWCACGKVRLASSTATHVAHEFARLHVHGPRSCTVYRIGAPDSSPKKGRKP